MVLGGRIFPQTCSVFPDFPHPTGLWRFSLGSTVSECCWFWLSCWHINGMSISILFNPSTMSTLWQMFHSYAFQFYSPDRPVGHELRLRDLVGSFQNISPLVKSKWSKERMLHWVPIRLWDALGTVDYYRSYWHLDHQACVAVLGWHVARTGAGVNVTFNVPLHFLLLQMADWLVSSPLIFFGMLLGAPEIWCFASLVIMKNIMCVSLFTLKQLKWPGICPIHDWSTMGQEPRRTKALSSMAMEATMTLDEAWCRSAMATLGGGNVFFLETPGFSMGFLWFSDPIQDHSVTSWATFWIWHDLTVFFAVVRPYQVSRLAGWKGICPKKSNTCHIAVECTRLIWD